MTSHESAAPRPELLYATSDTGDLLLIPAEVAEDIAHARDALPGLRTWGDARHELAGRYFLELVDEFIGPGEEPPADQETLDVRSLINAGDWPGIFYDDAVESRRDEIVEWFRASRFEFGYPAVISAGDTDDLIRYLRESGIACYEDAGILGLLVY
jgi:hypothetical protein